MMVSVVLLVVSGFLSVVTGLLVPVRRSRGFAASVTTTCGDDWDDDIPALKERVEALQSQVADLEEEEVAAKAVVEVQKRERPPLRPVLSSVDGQLNLESLLCRLDVKRSSGTSTTTSASDELARFAKFCGFAEMTGPREEMSRGAMTFLRHQRSASDMPLTRLLLLADHEPSVEWLEQAGLADPMSAALSRLKGTTATGDAMREALGEAVHEQLRRRESRRRELENGGIESAVVTAARSLWRDWVSVAAAAEPACSFEEQREALVATVAEESEAIESLSLSSITLARKMANQVDASLVETVKRKTAQMMLPEATFLELRFRERLRELARRDHHRASSRDCSSWPPKALEELSFAMELLQLERSRAQHALKEQGALGYVYGAADTYIRAGFRDDFKTLLKKSLGEVDALGQRIDFDDDAQLRTAFSAKGDEILALLHRDVAIFFTLLSCLLLCLVFNFVLEPIGDVVFLKTLDRFSATFSAENLHILYGPLLNRLSATAPSGSPSFF